MPQPDRPESYPRRVLLAVTGLSPQIVTETLFALAVTREPAWVPTEVQVLTTVRGADNARLNLLADEPGWFHRLRRDYGLPEIAFGPESIRVMRSAGGAVLDDIRNEADNIAVADFITGHLRMLTADENASLHVSIAGGRKTMGFYIGYALSLFGRAQDRLSHVLVTAPFESHQDFYYPSPTTRVIQTPSQTLDAKNAQVWLGDIPFVRLREGLPEALLAGGARFSDVIAAAQQSLAAPSLVADRGAGRVIAGGIVVEMAPADRAFYVLMACCAAEGRTLRHDDDGLAREYLREYARLAKPASEYYAKAEKRLADEFLDSWFEERKSKCNAALRNALGAAAARPYLIQGFGQRGRTRYGLALPSDVIHILDDLPGAPASLWSGPVPANP